MYSAMFVFFGNRKAKKQIQKTIISYLILKGKSELLIEKI